MYNLSERAATHDCRYSTFHEGLGVYELHNDKRIQSAWYPVDFSLRSAMNIHAVQ